jgi:hypothetical protein
MSMVKYVDRCTPLMPSRLRALLTVTGELPSTATICLSI